MNSVYQKPTTITPLNSKGGSTSIYYGLSSLLSWFTGFRIFLILMCIFFLFVGYYVIKASNYNSSVTFNANREHLSKDSVTNRNATLMLFYVDWCPHCKTAKPEWETLKAEYDGKAINGYTLNFVEHNCTNEDAEISELMDKYSIEGYPTIKLVKDNQIIEYDAKPTKSTMEQFLNTVL